MFDLLLGAPKIGTTVLQEEDHGGGFRRCGFVKVHDLDPLLLVHLLAVLVLHRLELHFLLLDPGGAGGALDKLFGDCLIHNRLALFYGLKKFGMRLLPGVDRDLTDLEGVSKVQVNRA